MLNFKSNTTLLGKAHFDMCFNSLIQLTTQLKDSVDFGRLYLNHMSVILNITKIDAQYDLNKEFSRLSGLVNNTRNASKLSPSYKTKSSGIGSLKRKRNA